MAATSSTAAGSASSGLRPVRQVLDNGVVLLTKQTRTTPAVSINLSMRAGSICDPPDTPGATYLLSRVIDRGTAARSADQIAEELDGRGVTLSLAVTRHVFSVVCTCLADDFAAVMNLVAEILMAPTVPDSELAARKREVVTAIRQDDDSPAVRATEALMGMLYADGHPYGRPTKGTIEIVEALDREPLASLHRRRFAPGVLTAAIVGDVEPSHAGAVVGRAFGAWAASTPAPVQVSRVPPGARRQIRVISMMNKAQADVAYGFTTIVRSDPSYYALWLMNHVFGQYSMCGRLGDNIREKQGMAYYVYSALDANVAEGPLLIRAGVSGSNVDRAIAAIDDEVTRLAREGVTQKELDDSRQYLIHAMPRSLETNAGIATFLQNAEFFGLGLDYDVRLPDLLRAVTRDEVNAVAHRHLHPDRAAVVIAGPYESR
jgi:zinc protease